MVGGWLAGQGDRLMGWNSANIYNFKQTNSSSNISSPPPSWLLKQSKSFYFPKCKKDVCKM